MNTAVLLLTACLPGQAQPGMATVAPGQVYPAPVVVTTPYRGTADCCGHASVSGDCCNSGEKQCCLSKLWSKLSCFKLDLCGKCDKGQACPQPCAPKPVCNPCPKPVCNPCPKVECPKPVCNPCPKPACNPCPKPACNPCPKVECPKPVCCKTQPTCQDSCAKPCWTPGYFLHKCKEKLSGLCGKNDCHGGVGTAATPNACGSTVIPPAAGPAPGTATPVAPVQPELKKMPQKVSSPYSPVNPTTTPASAPRTIDLGSPF